MEVVIYRKDRSHPIVVREYLDEVYRPLGVYKDGNKMKPGPWQSHTKRMLRGKTLIQGGRLAFGFSGIYDDDEAARVVEAIDVTPIQTEAPERSAGSRLKAALGVTAGGETLEGTATVVKEVEKHLAETIDTDTGEIMQTNPPADEPHPFDTEKSAAAPEAKATIEQQIEAAPDNPALSKLLPAIMKMKAGPERDRIMQKWNAKVKSFSKPATPSPSAPDPQPSPATEPPAPSEGAAPKPRKPKPKGTPELQAGVMEQMKTAKTVEELDTIADAANEYAWNDEAREALSAEYLKLKDDLEGAGN